METTWLWLALDAAEVPLGYLHVYLCWFYSDTQPFSVVLFSES